MIHLGVAGFGYTRVACEAEDSKDRQISHDWNEVDCSGCKELIAVANVRARLAGQEILFPAARTEMPQLPKVCSLEEDDPKYHRVAGFLEAIKRAWHRGL